MVDQKKIDRVEKTISSRKPPAVQALAVADQLRELTRQCLPAYMIVIVQQSIVVEFGMNAIRQDLIENGTRALQAITMNLDDLLKLQLVARLEEQSAEILREPNADTLFVLWVALARAIALATSRDERFNTDAHLWSAAVCAWSSEEIDQYGGEKAIRAATAKLDNAMRARGWWYSTIIPA